jgi:hypothetical protein
MSSPLDCPLQRGVCCELAFDDPLRLGNLLEAASVPLQEFAGNRGEGVDLLPSRLGALPCLLNLGVDALTDYFEPSPRLIASPIESYGHKYQPRAGSGI